jgi:hypothetical protein
MATSRQEEHLRNATVRSWEVCLGSDQPKVTHRPTILQVQEGRQLRS